MCRAYSPGLVREVGDGLAVGRPGRVALHDARRSRQVPDVALLGRDGQDLAAGLEHGPGAVRRDGGRGDARADLDVVRPDLGQVALERDRDGLGRARGRVEQAEGAELLDDDPAGAGRGRLEVEAVVPQGLLDLLRRQVVDEERHGALPVGQEVDLVAEPDRVRVVGVLAGDLLDLEVGHRDDPDGRRLPALVALPGHLPLHGRHVGQARAVGGVGAGNRGRERQLLGEAALEAHGVERGDSGRRARPSRAEEDPLAVGRPADDLVRIRMIGQPAGDAPGRRDDIDVRVPVVLPGEGDERAVGGEGRQALEADAGRQPRGRASVAPDEPEVAGVGEDDVRPAERRVLGQERLFGRRQRRAGGQDENDDDRKGLET